ncbi:hypothetical protein MMC29_003219 [Sticta canariensis]|nr:hypothetical protein [Sticta canariensis]
MFSLDAESLPSSQQFESAQPPQDERDTSSEKEEDESSSNAQHDLASPTASTISTSQVIEDSSPLSEEHSDQSEPRPASRPNKYNGPPSTWLGWIASQRELAESLNRLRAKDLAVHLYNAHALKERARTVGAQRKLHLTHNGDNSTDGQEWMPPKSWTAWPLPPDLVPTDIDCPHWASQEFCQPSRSGNKLQLQREELQDLLVAQVIKKAKQRNFNLKQNNCKRWPPKPEPEIESMEQSGDSIISDSSESLDEPEHEIESMEHSDESSITDSLDELAPVILLDDDVANSLLQPMIHHILNKLDGLLEGLHHARNSYLPIGGSDGRESVNGPPQKKRSISRAGLRRAKLKPSVQSLTSRPEINLTSDTESTAKSSRTRQRSTHQRLSGLQDWSDVLGVASMIGWDSTVVQKAAFRCSKLFKEGIKFRRLEENRNGSNEISILPDTSFSPLRSTSDEMLHQDRRFSSESDRVADSQGVEAKKTSWKYRCPFSTCNRSSRRFSSFSALNRHTKRVHEGTARSQQDSRSSSGSGSESDQVKDSQGVEKEESNWKFRCPVSTCNRSNRGYTTFWTLRRHTKHAHEGVEQDSSWKSLSSIDLLQQDSHSSSGSDQVNDSQGVEKEGSNWKFCCPVSTCNRSNGRFPSFGNFEDIRKQVHERVAALENLGVKEIKEGMVRGVKESEEGIVGGLKEIEDGIVGGFRE